MITLTYTLTVQLQLCKGVWCVTRTWQSFNINVDRTAPIFLTDLPAKYMITLTYTVTVQLQLCKGVWRVMCTWQAFNTGGDSTGEGCSSGPYGCRGDLPGVQDAHKGGGHQAHLPVDVGHLQPAIDLMGHLHLHGQM